MKTNNGNDTTQNANLILLLLSIVGSGAATTVPAVQGTVFDDTGKPVAGARVLIAAALPATAPHFIAPPVVTGPVAATATSDAKGSFSIATLPAGQYVACAETSTPGLLDPCYWATSAPIFTIAAAKPTGAVNITMARGVVVPIHIDDPQSLLKPTTGPVDFNLQVQAVTAKGHRYNASIQTSTPTSRDHVITIPFGTAIAIQVLASHLIVNDQSGKLLPSAGTSLSISSGGLPPSLSYVVAGKK